MISSTTRIAGPYAGTGSQTVFSFSFKVFQASDVLVVATDASGNNTNLTLTTGYSVALNANQNTSPGGTITTVATPASGTTITISSQVAALQGTDLTNAGNFYPTVVNNALDYLTILVQQLISKVSNSLQLPINVSGVSTTLPTPASNKLLGWNSSATAMQNVDPTTLATIVAFGTANADKFTGTGSQTSFTLSANPGALNNLDVAISGVTQTPGTDYTWTSGTTITFTAAPALNAKILVRYMQGLPQGVTDAGLVTYSDSGSYSSGSVGYRLKQLLSSIGASLVGYLPAGTGAVPTTVQTKLRESVSVLDFYANGASGASVDPTGIVDSTLGIKAAQTYCGTSIALIWPAGTYKVTQQLTQTGFWYAQGSVTLQFSGLGSTTDCLLITGGATYAQTITDGFIVDCQATGRDGVVLVNGDYPRVRVRVVNAQRDGFAVFCGGDDWVENAELDIFTTANGRHGCRFEVWGAGVAFFNESVIKLEVRGVSRRYNGGVGLLGYCPVSVAGNKISAIHFQRINLDAQRATAVANGFDIGQNPIYLQYAAGGTNSFEAWTIDGGGWETTTGSNDFRSSYLIYAEAGVSAPYWNIRGIVPYNWSSGDAVFGLTNYVFQSCKGNGFIQTSFANSSGSNNSALNGYTASSYGVPITIPLFDPPINTPYGSTYASAIYDLTISYQQYSGAGQEMQVRRLEVGWNKTGSGAYWLSSIVLASNIGTMITAINSVTIAGTNIVVNLNTGAGFAGGGGSSLIMVTLTKLGNGRV